MKDEEKTKYKMKIVYNHKKLNLLRKKEITTLNKKIKNI